MWKLVVVVAGWAGIQIGHWEWDQLGVEELVKQGWKAVGRRQIVVAVGVAGQSQVAVAAVVGIRLAGL